MSEIEVSEGAEVKLHRGIVMQKQAELEIANSALIEARKREYIPVAKAQLVTMAKVLGKVFYVLSPNDFEQGLFEYRSRVELGDSGEKVSIGGWWDNDRFRGPGAFVQRAVWDQFLIRSEQ